jgi:prophage regulatory protein
VDESTRAVLNQLERDPGGSTLDQLVRDRRMAIDEIVRLSNEVEWLQGRPEVRRTQAPHRQSVQGGVLPIELLALKDVCALLGASRSAIYRWVQEGRFPPPVRTGMRSVRWRIGDLERWRMSLRTRVAPPTAIGPVANRREGLS